MIARKIIATTILGLAAGAAVASERQIDYTGQQSSLTRAEVLAEARAFDAKNQNYLARANETYGYFEPSSSIEKPVRHDLISGNEDFDFRANEAYGGFPQSDMRQGRGE